jgi:tetratricopeptide (TPR) repeat protein
LKKAEELYGEALDIQTRILPEDHPDRLQTMNNLAALKSDQKDYEAAIELYRKVLRFRQQKGPENHPETLNAMNNLAWTLVMTGDLEGADGLYERILEIMDRHPERKYVEKHHWIYNYARLLILQQRGDEAIPLGREALEERIILFGDRDRLTLDSATALASVLFKEGQIPKAEEMARKWSEIADKALLPKDLTRIELHSIYGQCLYSREQYEKAAEQLKCCYEGAVAGGDFGEAAGYLGLLVKVYDKAGLPEKAREFEARALEKDGVRRGN